MSDIVLMACAVLFYFIPSLLGMRKPNSTSIIILNTLLGWTVIGWIVALVKALTKDPIAAQLRTQPLRQPTDVPMADIRLAASAARLASLKDLRNRGVLTEEEYLRELGKL